MTTYSTGTLSVGAGSTSVTGAGTAWAAGGVRAGDILIAAGYAVPILTVGSATSITLARPWPGGALAGANYDILLIDDNVRTLVAANTLMQSLGNGTLTSLAGLASAANKLPYFSGANAMALTDLTSQARGLLGGTALSRSGSTYTLAGSLTVNGTLDGSALTASDRDRTAGKLVKVGDYGLGGAATLGGTASLHALELPPGNYSYSTGGSVTGGPETGAWPHALQVIEISSSTTGSVRRRMYISARVTSSLSSCRVWVGFNQGTDPISWAPLPVGASITGTVSQSGGVPTGAVIERGSNANGEYTRWADGTQVCSVVDFDMGSVVAAGAGTYADPWRTDASVNITWPAAFSAAPAVAPSLRISGDSAVAPGSRSLLLQAALKPGMTVWNNLRAQRCTADSTARNALLTVTAYGRWY